MAFVVKQSTALALEQKSSHSFSLKSLREILGCQGTSNVIDPRLIPFGADDVTVGSETELQAAVLGTGDRVDLPIRIRESNYFANILRRAASGDTSTRAITDLEEYLNNNAENIWENSWVRFPMACLNQSARKVFDYDLLLDKRKSNGALRTDTHKFIYLDQGKEFVRVPISYVMKLALADVIGSQEGLPEIVGLTGVRLMDHLLNDNTSPETFSFNVVPVRLETGLGRALAKETSKRYLLTQLLIVYANKKFLLETNGQKALLYFSPHPPTRQKKLNDCISDSFYRDLFMSPCLNGWDTGQMKHDYMCLCHQVLSRSQLNAVAKLREAGIITRNLVVLPNVSNISLANNGTHVSLGSVKLSDYLSCKSSGFTATHEKFLGDLVIKIVEHFLPLFVGTYSAAPYRLGFADFHPEKVLGFLPHELDYTHLRMIWRRWKKKAKLKILGQPVTPFGVDLIDKALTTLFRVKGDFVPDFRLIDYMVSVMSTNESPALDGKPGNTDRLKKDLSDLGVFDEKMAPYFLYRLREFSKLGFSGFEGRHYSLFQNMGSDMANAVNLQILITAMAFKFVLLGKVSHHDIPDDPFIESERRQVFFGSAIGIPTFYVLKQTSNIFLRKVLDQTRGLRHSRRYPGYLRVHNHEYLIGLVRLIRAEAYDLIEAFNLHGLLDDLCRRIQNPSEFSSTGRLTKAILETLGAKSPMNVDAETFNLSAEEFYRAALKRDHIREGINFLLEDLDSMEVYSNVPEQIYREALDYVVKDIDPQKFINRIRDDILNEEIPLNILGKLIYLVIITIHHDNEEATKNIGGSLFDDRNAASVR
ncbi:MAG: hypothetical protein M1511_14905 [Deltaproteobacteria bacterium]|nr:hypothetical protein [Deltaproteobacteria bacterium]